MAQPGSDGNFAGDMYELREDLYNDEWQSKKHTHYRRRQVLLSGGVARLFADLIVPPKCSAPLGMSDGSLQGRRQLRRGVYGLRGYLYDDEWQSKEQTHVEQKQVLQSRGVARFYASLIVPPESSTPWGLSDGAIRRRQQRRRNIHEPWEDSYDDE